ncbi:hypothetical protein SAMN05444171_6321 [Bradyrhizobium lablabi]|uniref:Uncharacterized protein n=2 Tax=Bradyrhizobium TaxID=374 RepID=A0ABY0P8Z7_9BRAD|nr:hypothetical protein SAMN05444163_0851 [Bradyrhizobium ottawaense]SEE11939.1 hypothetical protein SAMN05444171_6321 [Bradyrhizobium lablabi]SHM07878.1 hypothetical protein SAMN05444321_5122 [Bradyrhizobium lablabi]
MHCGGGVDQREAGQQAIPNGLRSTERAHTLLVEQVIEKESSLQSTPDREIVQVPRETEKIAPTAA